MTGAKRILLCRRDHLVAHGVFDEFRVLRDAQFLHNPHLMKSYGPVGDLQYVAVLTVEGHSVGDLRAPSSPNR